MRDIQYLNQQNFVYLFFFVAVMKIVAIFLFVVVLQTVQACKIGQSHFLIALSE